MSLRVESALARPYPWELGQGPIDPARGGAAWKTGNGGPCEPHIAGGWTRDFQKCRDSKARREKKDKLLGRRYIKRALPYEWPAVKSDWLVRGKITSGILHREPIDN